MAIKNCIENLEILDRHLNELCRMDRRLGPLRARWGPVPLRRGPKGFAGLSAIVNAQLLSVTSAAATLSRLQLELGRLEATRFLAAPKTRMRACGLSNAKYATLYTLARAELDGKLDYTALARLPPAEAAGVLTAFTGVGQWTADLYLLSALGHPDIFPAGDLVLRKMVAHVNGWPAPASEPVTRKTAQVWSPYGGAAARLLWRGFAARAVSEKFEWEIRN
ncbi:MAG: DNA-3-methyladenine glycosylase 2 family protein [Alphaproteobacteria bacterium]|nr:DNA-3-methyladenine glycosylase 2 family protein [Alphaproteobacteria bacterium]